MPLLSEYIPKHDRAGFAFEISDLKLLRPLDHIRIVSTRLAQSREIAFHVRHENRHAPCAEIFRERLQRDRFSRSGGAGDQAVAVCHFW
jgi:hypothetical protein